MIEFYLLIAALSFLVLYFAVKKLSLSIDEKALLEPIKSELYPQFCDCIDGKIRELKEGVEGQNLSLKNPEQKEDFLEKLGDLSRELTFIQTMNLSKKNEQIWQKELFDFLKDLENLILEFLEQGEEIGDRLRQELMEAFENLKKE